MAARVPGLDGLPGGGDGSDERARRSHGRSARIGAAVGVAAQPGSRLVESVDRFARSGTAVAVPVDVRDASSVTLAVREAVVRLGGVDMLVNNAGIGMRTVTPRFLEHPQHFFEVDPGAFDAWLAAYAHAEAGFAPPRQARPFPLKRRPVAPAAPNVAAMDLLLVRHAHAGNKDAWRGDDRLRPLSERGRAEARALVGLLAPYGAAQVVSSPLVRCLQTVEPLASSLGLPIEQSDALGPQADRDAARLLRSLASGRHTVVVCTHGETIEALQRRIARHGKLGFGPGGAHEKGSVWLLRANRGRFTSAAYLPPVDAGRVGSGGPRDEATS